VAVMAETISGQKRSTYLKTSAEKKVQIGKYAAEHGIMSAFQFSVNALN